MPEATLIIAATSTRHPCPCKVVKQRMCPVATVAGQEVVQMLGSKGIMTGHHQCAVATALEACRCLPIPCGRAASTHQMPVHIAPACSCPFASSVRTALLLLLPFIPAAAIATRGLPLLAMGRCQGRGALTIDGGQELLPQGARCEKPRIWPSPCSILSVTRQPSDSRLASTPVAAATPKKTHVWTQV